MMRPLACMTLFLALLWAQSLALVSSGPKEVGGLPRPAKRTPIVHDSVRIDNCVSCHDQKKKNPADYTVTFNESTIWNEHDRHKDAWRVLKGARAQQMAAILKYPVETDARCLSCHGAVVDVKDKDQMRVLDDYGVNCAVCHGPYEEWYAIHQGVNPKERSAWRQLDRADKDRYWGMFDLWDAGRRAEICASCHVGNVAEGKVVTHEMYAAGHPPLPGFELATFSQQMPPHWLSLRQKKEAQKAGKIHPQSLEFARVTDQEIDLEFVHLLGIGALRAQQAAIDLIGGHAALPKDSWPELAVFDCYACHHDLQNPSWRLDRGFVGKPGRPQMRPWGGALLSTGLWHAARGDGKLFAKLHAETEDRLLQLARTFDARPFGDPPFVAKAAAQTSDLLARLIAQADPRKEGFPPDHARTLLARLAADAASHTPDFDSARQMSWAFNILRQESDAAGKLDTDAAMAWKSLHDHLSLKLPVKGQPITEMKPGQTGFYLETALDRLNAYHPRLFHADFARLVKGLR